ncbi:hypothetical protein D3C71_1729450 [compost metagenome]
MPEAPKASSWLMWNCRLAVIGAAVSTKARLATALHSPIACNAIAFWLSLRGRKPGT